MAHILFDFEELCPECGKEASGVCNENLAGICNHCGSEITICSICPSTCVCKDNREADWCEICHPFCLQQCQCKVWPAIIRLGKGRTLFCEKKKKLGTPLYLAELR